MNVSAAAEQLRRRIGLDPLSLGPKVLSSIVAERMRILGMTDPRHYAAHLADCSEELAALIDDVVVPETWFFRGGKVFSFLAEHVRRATESAAAPPFRILSAPCSSGEEPYSLAIALVDAGVPRERWRMAAVDLSSRALSRARQGVYRELAFRETSEAVKRKFFHKAEDGWEIDPALRGLVQFHQGNLLDPELLAGESPFDLIFCRNLLIYLHDEARTCVLANLERLLAPRGLLCMGHAEPLSLLDKRFQAIGPHDHFLFERVTVPITSASGRRQPADSSRESKNQPADAGRSPSRRRTTRSSTPSVPAIPDRLVQARQEADAGALDKALHNCQSLIAEAQPSADAFSLLGVIHQARHERAQAAECFRKALYLDPDHAEALLHLMLLYQESGDEAAAKLLRRRLHRKTAGGER